MGYLELREQYFRHGLDRVVLGRVYAFLFDVLSAYLQRAHFPNFIAPESDWSESSVRGILDASLGEGKLNIRAMFDICDSEVRFRKFAETQFLQYLLNQKPPSEKANLFRRIKDILRKDPEFKEFVRSESALMSSWGLSRWESCSPWQSSVVELTLIAETVELPPRILYKPGSKYHSPLISTKGLKAFILELFTKTDQKRFTLSQIVEVISRRLGALDNARIVLVSPEDDEDEEGAPRQTPMEQYPDSDSGVLDNLQIEEDVEKIISQMDEKKLRAFYAMAQEGATLETVATRMNVSHQTVSNYMKDVQLTIAECASGEGTEYVELLYRNLIVRIASSQVDEKY